MPTAKQKKRKREVERLTGLMNRGTITFEMAVNDLGYDDPTTQFIRSMRDSTINSKVLVCTHCGSNVLAPLDPADPAWGTYVSH